MKSNTPKTNTEKTILVPNPVDSLIIINASEAVRKSILSKPWYCRGYVDCMELAPGARAFISSLRKQPRDVEIVLESPYDEEIVEAVAEKFRIPYTSIRRVRSRSTTGPAHQVEMRLQKMAS